MYFTIKYIEWSTYEKTKDVDTLSDDVPVDVKNTLSLKNKSLAVNPDCFIAIIMDYIFEEIGIPNEKRVDFDMITEEGKQLNVHNYPPDFNGLHIFDDKAVYFIGYHQDGDIRLVLSRNSPEYLDYIGARRKSSTRKIRSSINKLGPSNSTTHRKSSLRSNQSARSGRSSRTKWQ